MANRSRAESGLAAAAGPVLKRSNLPLRVNVYSALAGAIRSGDPEPGSLLPIEADLCATFEVSRTVMREALMLLEEDGLIRTRRGVGRFVVDNPPQVGLEQLRTLEEILDSADDPVRIAAIQRGVEPASDFVARELDLPNDCDATIWESRLLRGEEPVALSQEWIPADAHLVERAPWVARSLRAVRPGELEQTLLSRLLSVLGGELAPSSVEVTASTAGKERGSLFSAKSRTPVLVLTQRAFYHGAPLYLAKYMLESEAGHVRVTQSPWEGTALPHTR